MRRFILFCLFIFVSPISIANEVQQCPKWWQIRHIYLDTERFTWQSIRKLRVLEQPCIDAEEYRTLAQYLATIEGKIGNHHAGLKWMDRFHGNSNSTAKPLDDFVAIDAIPYIVKRAQVHRIVVTNERHHASSDRLLPLYLLKPLKNQGFKYLAVETLSSDHTINELGYAKTQDGYYSNDVVYAELLRTARAIGYEIIAYEQEHEQIAPEDPDKPINRSTERDHWQAKNIISRVFEKDPNAKILIHCGYGHVSERKLRNSTPMTYFLKNLTGLDPLTISQTHYSERGESKKEHPRRKQVANQGLLDDNPKVLLTYENDLIGSGTGADIGVIGLRTRYENGRPVWMRMGGIRQPISASTPECIDHRCIVEVIDPNEVEDAVPFDRLEVAHSNRTTLYVPANKTLKMRVMDLDGNILNSRYISAN